MKLLDKLQSRKFIAFAAVFLSSLGAGLSGLVTSNQWIAVAGIICTALSAGFYQFAEGYVDGKAATANTTTTTTTKSVAATVDNAAKLVNEVLKSEKEN